MPVGATLVRHSDPASEVAETHAKAAGVLAALGVRPRRPCGRSAAGRGSPTTRGCGPRWTPAAPASRRSGCGCRTADDAGRCTAHALVVDGEDTFTAMLAHLLRAPAWTVTVRRYDEPGLREAALAHEGPVVLGPGPGRSGATRPTRRCGSCAG